MKYVCIGSGSYNEKFHVVDADSEADAWYAIEMEKPLFECKSVLSEMYINYIHSVLQAEKFAEVV